jgi:hypothetical protein
MLVASTDTPNPVTHDPTMATTEGIRRRAMAPPEIEETSQVRFHVPVFTVRGRCRAWAADQTAFVR